MKGEEIHTARRMIAQGATYAEVADTLKVSRGMAWRIVQGQESYKARRALGVVKTERDRMAASLTREEGKALRLLLESFVGYDSITDFWQAVLRGDIAIIREDEKHNSISMFPQSGGIECVEYSRNYNILEEIFKEIYTKGGAG